MLSGRSGFRSKAVWTQASKVIIRGSSAPAGELLRTRRFNKVLELSFREARQIGHNYVDTEHLLLGIIREGEGMAARIVVDLGVDLARFRDRVVQLISSREANESVADRL